MATVARTRSFLIALVAALGATLALPAQPAHALDLPFEVTFPQDVKNTSFSNTWGARRPGGRRHKGTDLMAEKMTEVYAFADGVITKVGSSGRSGRHVIIEHPEGWDTYYIHLNDDNPGTDDGDADWDLTVAPGIEVGAEVEAGQLIGWVGDSGNAEGSKPHTHFELLRNGRNVNPYHVLLEAYEAALIRENLRESQLEIV